MDGGPCTTLAIHALSKFLIHSRSTRSGPSREGPASTSSGTRADISARVASSFPVSESLQMGLMATVLKQVSRADPVRVKHSLTRSTHVVVSSATSLALVATKRRVVAQADKRIRIVFTLLQTRGEYHAGHRYTTLPPGSLCARIFTQFC